MEFRRRTSVSLCIQLLLLLLSLLLLLFNHHHCETVSKLLKFTISISAIEMED